MAGPTQFGSPTPVVATDAAGSVLLGGNAVTAAQGTAASLSGAWPVEVSDGTNVLLTSTHPGYVRQDSTGTIAKETGGNLATIAGAVTSSVMQDNVDQWGGTAVTAAQQMPPTAGALVGTEEAPLIRPVQRKWTQILATSLAGGGTFTSSWFDSNADGALAVNVQVYPTQNLSSLNLQQTDDTTTSGNEFATTIAVNGSSKIQGLVSLTARYWRVVLVNGATIQGAAFEITATAMSFIPAVVGSSGLPFTQESGSGLMGVGIIGGGGVADNSQSYTVSGNATAIGGNISALGMAVTTGSSANSVMLRTPNLFKTVQFTSSTSSGNNAVWTPTSGKKFRLMGYKITVSDDSSLSSAGIETLQFEDSSSVLGIAEDIYIPSTALKTELSGFNSGAVQLGNGILSAAANNVLNLNIGTQLAAGVIRCNVWGTEE